MATVTNLGTTPESFHIVFSQYGQPAFYTSSSQSLNPGDMKDVVSEFECVSVGTINICADLVCEGECYGADCNPTGNPIGGYSTYSRIITSGIYTVTTADQLISALGSAPGIIYIQETANIDMTGRFNISIPSGFTLASNRGQNGSYGGRIFQLPSSVPSPNPVMFWVGDNVRITGLRIDGSDTSSAQLTDGTQRLGIGCYNHKGL